MSNVQEESVFTPSVPALPRYVIGWAMRINEAIKALANRTLFLRNANHFKGLHGSLTALRDEYPSAQSGNYALVDTGIDNEADLYYWDVNEGWVTQGSGFSLANTDALIEGNSNFYCTNSRVRQVISRENVSFSAAALANNATATNTVNIASRYQLLNIITNHPCRVRLYVSAGQRDADITRLIGTDPIGNHGLLFEFISTNELLSADLSPLVDGFSDFAAIPYSLTNLSGETQTITVTLNHVKTGA